MITKRIFNVFEITNYKIDGVHISLSIRCFGCMINDISNYGQNWGWGEGVEEEREGDGTVGNGPTPPPTNRHL